MMQTQAITQPSASQPSLSLSLRSLILIQWSTGTNRLWEGAEGSEFIQANGSQGGEMK